MRRVPVHLAPRGARPLGAALLGLALACSVGDPPLDQRVTLAIRAAHPEYGVEIVAPDELKVTGPGDLELTMFLGNLRMACDEDPASCDTFIERRVRSLTDHQDIAAGASQLRPVLKSAEYLAQADQMAAQADTPEAAAASKLLRKAWLGDLFVVWVLDKPDSMSMVAQREIEDLGMTQEAIEAKAIENLRACCSELLVEPVEDAPGLFQVWVGDSYEASRLLLHEPWGALAEKVPGDLVVAAPNREVVLFTGSDDGVGLSLLQQIVPSLAEGAYGLSTQLYRWIPEAWQVVEIEAVEEPG